MNIQDNEDGEGDWKKEMKGKSNKNLIVKGKCDGILFQRTVGKTEGILTCSDFLKERNEFSDERVLNVMKWKRRMKEKLLI